MADKRPGKCGCRHKFLSVTFSEMGLGSVAVSDYLWSVVVGVTERSLRIVAVEGKICDMWLRMSTHVVAWGAGYVKVDLGNKAVGGQLNNVVVKVAKASVIANHVDGQYSSRNRGGHKHISVLEFQLV